MTYIDGFVLPIKPGRRQDHIDSCRTSGPLFLEYGALHVVETFGDADVPEGKTTDLWRAVAADKAAGEGVAFSWIVWPSKEARDKGWDGLMRDDRMKPGADMPFDGARMIFGGFDVIYDSQQG